MKTEHDHKDYRVISFCDLRSKTEFRLAINLPSAEFTNAEIADIYCCRWQIKILWKLFNLYLKLDKLITKNRNRVRIQIHVVILQLIEIPSFYGQRLLDKFRYLQLELRHLCSLVHWGYDLLPETLVL